MKIVMSINTAWNIYNFRLGLIEALIQKGHEVIALAPMDEYTSLLEKANIQCFSLELDSKGKNPLQDLKLTYKYYQILKKIKPDIFLGYTIKPNIYGNLAAKLLRIKVINNVSGLGTLFLKENFSTKIGIALYRAAFFKAEWVFFQNNTDRQLFLDKKVIKVSHSSLLPGSGVNISHFKTNRTRNKGNIILFVGRLIGDKGIWEFIEAAKLLLISNPNLKFKITGEFGYNNPSAVSKEDLDEWLKIPQIDYLGKVDNMIDVYREVDIMVLPSYREGLSKSLIEACAMELPIVTTDVTGCKEVVENGLNGFLCRPKDFIDLADKILKTQKLSEVQRLEMGKNGRRLAEKKFNEKIVISEYLEKIQCLENNSKNNRQAETCLN